MHSTQPVQISVRLSQLIIIISLWNTCMSQYEINRVALCIKKVVVSCSISRPFYTIYRSSQQFTDTRFIRTPHYNGQCAFLIRTLSMAPSHLHFQHSLQSVQLQASFGPSKSTTFYSFNKPSVTFCILCR